MPEVPKGVKPLRMGRDRLKSPKHLAYVAEQPCCCCGAMPSVPHHLMRADPKRGAGRKAGDQYVIPLCAHHHDNLHNYRPAVPGHGSEPEYLAQFCVDGASLAAKLWSESQ